MYPRLPTFCIRGLKLLALLGLLAQSGCQLATELDSDPLAVKGAHSGLSGNSTSEVLQTPITVEPIHTYFWEKSLLEASPILHPFAWISDLTNPQEVARVRSELLAQAPGHRTLFIFHGYEDFESQPADQCKNGAGQLTGFRCPWYEAGVALVKPRLLKFYSDLKASGTPLDQVVMDFEGGISMWAPDFNLNALNNDPRFKRELLPQFGPGRTSIMDSAHPTDYLLYNELSGLQVIKAAQSILYDTAVQAGYTHLRMSNFGAAFHSSAYKVPDANGHKVWMFGSGGMLGTDQGPVAYGGLGNMALYQVNFPEGATTFPYAPYTAFIYDLNALRSSKLSNPAPIDLWISRKSFSWAYGPSDLFQEMIFHSMLTGIHSFLNWNDSHTLDDDEVLLKSLREVNALAGFSDRATLATDLLNWNNDFALTGARANGRNIYRLTPHTGTNVSLFMGADGLHIHSSAATDTVLPRAHVLNVSNSASSIGFWIEQTP